jgi:hypothetical protein
MQLEFDEASHIYRVAGAVIPSVTQILRPLFDFRMIDPAVLQAKAEIGTAVHRAAELLDNDDLDEESDDGRAALEPIAGYLDGYKKFKAEKRPMVIENETRLYHPLHKFAGTCDRVYQMDGERVIVDLKTTAAMSPAVGVQLAAYDELFRANGSTKNRMKRFALQLKSNGTYKLYEFSEYGDWPTFLSLLTIFRWRDRYEK